MKTNTLKSRISENPYFFTLFGLFFTAGCVLLLIINKGEETVFFNDWRGTYWDSIFLFFSTIGEGEYFAGFLIILGIYRFKYLVTGVTVYLGAGAITQILKNMFKEPRPKVFFEGKDIVTYCQNLDLHSWNSFPSGHATTGFVIFLFLAMITKNKQLGILYFFAAFMVAISRVFLVQHFLIDIYFGSVIGVFFTAIIYNLFENSDKIYNSKWYNYSVRDNFITNFNKKSP